METDFLPLCFKEPFISVLPKEADNSTIVVKTHYNNETATAPVKKGDIMGYAEIIYAEKVIGTVDLVAAQDVKASGILTFFELVKDIFKSKAMQIVYALIGLAILGFIIVMIKLNWPRKKKRIRYIPYKDGEYDNDKN